MRTRQQLSKQTRKANKVVDPSRYPVELFYSEDDGGFIAIARDLPGCSAFGRLKAEPLHPSEMPSRHGCKPRMRPAIRYLNPLVILTTPSRAAGYCLEFRALYTPHSLSPPRKKASA